MRIQAVYIIICKIIIGIRCTNISSRKTNALSGREIWTTYKNEKAMGRVGSLNKSTKRRNRRIEETKYGWKRG